MNNFFYQFYELISKNDVIPTIVKKTLSFTSKYKFRQLLIEIIFNNSENYCLLPYIQFQKHSLLIVG